MNKDLKDKAIDIKGKQYVQVADRILYFNDTYKDGCIITDLVRYENKHIIIMAKIYPEGLDGRYFSGYAQEVEGEGYINKTSALENAETSAVGRALAMMGIGVIDSIASIDEINKANNRDKAPIKVEKEAKKIAESMQPDDDTALNIRLSGTMEELHGIWNKLDDKEQKHYSSLVTIRKKEISIK